MQDEEVELDLQILRKLAKERQYVRLADKLPFGIRQLYYFITGAIGFSLLLYMLFFYLWIFLFVAPFYYYCKCYQGGVLYPRKIVGQSSFPTKYRSCFCHPCMTIYFGHCRLKLITTPSNKRGYWWHLKDKFVAFYQILEFIVNVEKSFDAVLSYPSLLANTFGTYFPLFYGIAVIDPKVVNEEIHCNSHVREPSIFSTQLNKTSEVFCLKAPVYLSTNTIEHTKSHAIIHAMLEDFYTKLQTQRSQLIIDLQRIIFRNPYAPQKEIRISIIKSLFYSLIGEELTYQEANTINNYLMLDVTINRLPSWGQFLLFGYFFERRLEKMFKVSRQAFLRNTQSTSVRAIIRKARELQVDYREAINLCTFCFLHGCDDLNSLVNESIEYFRKDPIKVYALWNENPDNYLKEIARLYTNPMASSNILKEDKVLNIGGENLLIPKGTHLISLFNMVHQNLEIFGGKNKSIEYASSFDPKRENLDCIVQWNAKEKYMTNKEKGIENAPRYCPGHDASFFIAEILVDRFKPYIPNEIQLPDEESFEKFTINFKRQNKEYFDSLPFHTKALVLGSKKFLQDAKTPKNEDISVPTEQPHQLQLASVDNFRIPIIDEDMKPGLQQYEEDFGGTILSLKIFKIEDVFAEFNNPIEGLEYRENIYSTTWPSLNTEWKDFSSDEIQSLFVFYGCGLWLTRRVNKEYDPCCPDNAYWICDATHLSLFKVRKGFEKFGHAAYFDKERKLLGIYWCDKNKYVSSPHVHNDNKKEKQNEINDEKELSNEWEHVKWAWRCSVGSSLTLNDHLLITHWYESNILDQTIREVLPPDHCLRRLGKIFTYRTSYINNLAVGYLVNQNGIVNRAFPFEYDEFLKIVSYCYQNYEFEYLPNKWKKNGITKEEFINDKECPVLYDSLELWDIMRSFIKQYLLIYYNNDIHSVLRDKDIIQFIKRLSISLTIKNINALFIDNIDDELAFNSIIDILTQLTIRVTGIHEYVGNLIEYKVRPDGYCGKIRPNSKMADIQAYSQLLVLGAVTGARVPGLINDFSHLIKDDINNPKVKKLFEEWQEKLIALSKDIDKKNSTSRLRPFNSFNPKVLECSVSI